MHKKKDLFILRIWKNNELRKVLRNSLKQWSLQWEDYNGDLKTKSIEFDIAVEAMTDIINGIIKDPNEYNESN